MKTTSLPIAKCDTLSWRVYARLAWLFFAGPLCAFAGTPIETPPEPADLTPANFFSVGWNEAYSAGPKRQGTPNLSLLRVQTNVLGRLLRTDFVRQENRETAATDESLLVNTTLDFALNRRLMISVVGNYRWLDSRSGEDGEGAAAGGYVRLRLLDTAHSSLSTTVRVGLPCYDLNERLTTLSFTVAGWQDLAPLGLHGVGLYYHVQEETLIGSAAKNARRNALNYNVSLAKTWTRKDAFFGNATTFIEAYARTDLDGEEAGHTDITLTPGLRVTFARRHSFMAGVEFPLTPERPFDRVVRLAYILCF